MPLIKHTFDSKRDIFRTIEKVITFDNREEDALKREVTEYVVTEKLKESFRNLFDRLIDGMEADSHEVGIWVSGFYGSGKSSFAKNFGLALDKQIVIENIAYKERLNSRINNLPVSQLLNKLVERYSPLVFLINLATKQLNLHGNTLPPVSDVIYHQVMKWAGFPPEEKVAMLERKLVMDGKFEAFKQKVKDEKQEDWDKVKFEDTLTAKAIASDFAPFFYPNIWKDAKSFNVIQIDSLEDESERMKAMFEVIKKKTGKENVLFIIDEVGQYISSKEELILHLQGTMENLKDIGKGKAWLLATAQQTLTEDNPNARFNSDKLYKLNDRFPIKVDIEASDIKEITTQRLLGKSPDGTDQIKALYTASGEQLRLNTRLTNVERTIYNSTLDEKSFIDLYPFLPYQFDIILSLLARLAKRTGGIGLRSAIRVIQDSLTEHDREVMLAEQPLGILATAYHIYDVLRSDIKTSYPHIAASVEKIQHIPEFKGDSLEVKIAKSVAVLQILDDFHLSVENLAVAMHPSVSSPGLLAEVRKKVDILKNTTGLTLKEIDGQLRFMTDAIIKIEDEKKRLFVSANDSRRALESQIEDLFAPVPFARVLNTKTVKSGIQVIWDGKLSKLAEPNEEIQTEIHFSKKAAYQQKFDEIKATSTEKANENKMFFIGQLEDGVDVLLEEIVRCEGIYGTRNRYSDKEILDYLNSQYQEAQSIKGRVKRNLASALENGDLIFRGTSKAASQSGANLKEMVNAWLKICAEKVYHKYVQASETIDTNTTENLMKFEDLRTLPHGLRFFDAIKTDGSINTSIPAIQSIKDFLQSEGQVEGRKLLEHFSGSPYGWNRESTRYLVAAMFLGSMVKLRIAGDSITVRGTSSIEKLSSNQNFNSIGISLYTEGQPTQQQIIIAQKNLTELTGEVVPPLPQRISALVVKHFPQFQTKYADLPLRLENLKLPGKEKADLIREGIEEILKGDASDATFRLGKENADLYVALKWAKDVYLAIENGIETTIKEIRALRISIDELPGEGVIADLKKLLSNRFDDLDKILGTDQFFSKAPELNDHLLEIKNVIETTCEQFRVQVNESITKSIQEIKNSYNWSQLSSEQKSEFLTRLEGSIIQEKEGVKGFREILNEAFSFSNLVTTINKEIQDCLQAKEPEPGTKKRKKVTLSHLPHAIEKKEDIELIINELNIIKDQLTEDVIIDLTW